MKRLLQTGLLSLIMLSLSLVTLVPPAGATGTALVADWISSDICNPMYECYFYRLQIYRNDTSYYAHGGVYADAKGGNTGSFILRSQIDQINLGVPGDIFAYTGPVNYGTPDVETSTPWGTYTGYPYNVQTRMYWSIRFDDNTITSGSSGLLQYGHFSY